MAFVNEYISEEDLKKYHVKETWREISPRFGGEDCFPPRFTWTVDKTIGVYFIPVRSGKEEVSNQKICALWWAGALLVVTIAAVGGGLDYENSKGEKIWDLVNINKPAGFDVPDSKVIDVLKEALVAYGYAGVKIPINDYKVLFAF